jgi:hypothetical protein
MVETAYKPFLEERAVGCLKELLLSLSLNLGQTHLIKVFSYLIALVRQLWTRQRLRCTFLSRLFGNTLWCCRSPLVMPFEHTIMTWVNDPDQTLAIAKMPLIVLPAVFLALPAVFLALPVHQMTIANALRYPTSVATARFDCPLAPAKCLALRPSAEWHNALVR